MSLAMNRVAQQTGQIIGGQLTAVEPPEEPVVTFSLASSSHKGFIVYLVNIQSGDGADGSFVQRSAAVETALSPQLTNGGRLDDLVAVDTSSVRVLAPHEAPFSARAHALRCAFA